MISPNLKMTLKKEEINWENIIVRPEHHELLQISLQQKNATQTELWCCRKTVVTTVCLRCVPWGITDSHVPCRMVPSSTSYHSVVLGSRLRVAIWPGMCQRTAHSVPSPKEQLIQKISTSPSCSTRSGSSRVHSHQAQARSTKRMLPHPRTVKILKMYLECHGGKKTIIGKINVAHNSPTNLTRKIL